MTMFYIGCHMLTTTILLYLDSGQTMKDETLSTSLRAQRTSETIIFSPLGSRNFTPPTQNHSPQKATQSNYTQIIASKCLKSKTLKNIEQFLTKVAIDDQCIILRSNATVYKQSTVIIDIIIGIDRSNELKYRKHEKSIN